MKNRSLLALSIALISSSTFAETPWYVSASYNFADTDSVRSTSGTSPGGATRAIGLELDDEDGFSIGIGRTVYQNDAGRVNIEIVYEDLETDISNIIFNGTNFSSSAGRANGSTDISTFSIGANYELKLGKFTPYAGIAFGNTDVDISGNYGGSIGSPGGTPPFLTGGDDVNSFIYKVGASYKITNNVDVFAEYKVTEADDIEFTRIGGGPGGLATTRQEGDFEIEGFSLGLKYRF